MAPTLARRPRRAPVLLAAGVAIAATAAITAVVLPAEAAVINTGASYQLINRNSGKALAVAGGATADGANVVQLTANAGVTSQQWQFVDSGGGYYRLRARHSGKALDVYNHSTADGGNVVQWADLNGLNQQWSVVDTTGGFVKLLNRRSAKALEVASATTADGGNVQQWADNGHATQQWQLVQVGGGTPNPGTTTAPPPGTPSGPTNPPASYPGPGVITGDTGVHDPEVTKTPSGGYILAATGNGIQLKTSSDRTAWRNAGSAFSGAVTWAHPYTNNSNHLWAPDIAYVNGQYYMYYSASTFGSNRSAIFLATSSSGAAGSWTNRGVVISSSSSNNYNAIDPNLVIDASGQWWLSFGSFWSGLKLIRLNSSNGLRSGSDLISLASFGNGIEAPTIVRRGNFYYLFVSFDRCCQGTSSTYRIMVGRSSSVTGPYVDRAGRAMTSGGGTQILARHGSIVGPGHQAVLEDTDGYVLFYHYYLSSGSRLGINLLGWDNAGWPFVY
ncbi:MAG TPA: family 43 glycosylhydrolase [Pilimelia sp.]|nr:family 43 glycosylhydrolase [Pilimelia sp.]